MTHTGMITSSKFPFRSQSPAMLIPITSGLPDLTRLAARPGLPGLMAGTGSQHPPLVAKYSKHQELDIGDSSLLGIARRCANAPPPQCSSSSTSSWNCRAGRRFHQPWALPRRDLGLGPARALSYLDPSGAQAPSRVQLTCRPVTGRLRPLSLDDSGRPD